MGPPVIRGTQRGVPPGDVDLGHLVRADRPARVPIEHQRVVARDDPVELAVQVSMNLAVGHQHGVGVAVRVAARPHLLDVRVPHDRVTGDDVAPAGGVHGDPLGAEGVAVLGQVAADAGGELLVVAHELQAVVARQLAEDAGVVAVERRGDPALLAQRGVEIRQCQRLQPALVLLPSARRRRRSRTPRRCWRGRSACGSGRSSRSAPGPPRPCPGPSPAAPSRRSRSGGSTCRRGTRRPRGSGARRRRRPVR